MTDHLLDGVLVRSAVHVSLALSLGPVVWRLAVVREPAEVCGVRWWRLAAGLGLVGAAIALVVHATIVVAQGWSVDAMIAVLRETAYGRMLALFCVATVAHVASFARGRERFTLLTGLAVIVAMTFLGHAALERWWLIGMQVVHATAVVAWLGGLAVLLAQIGHGKGSLDALRRFSRLARILVIAILVTGVIRAAATLVGGEDARVWIAVLAIKVGFVGTALAVAYRHRRSGFHGVSRDGEPAWPRMQRMLIVETWLVGCALLFAALLSQVPAP